MSDIDLNGRVTRWGRHTLGPVTAYAVGGDGLFISRGARTGTLTVKAYPVTEVFDADEAMPRAAGHVGGAPVPPAGRGWRDRRRPQVRPGRPAPPDRLAGLAADPRAACGGHPLRP